MPSSLEHLSTVILSTDVNSLTSSLFWLLQHLQLWRYTALLLLPMLHPHLPPYRYPRHWTVRPTNDKLIGDGNKLLASIGFPCFLSSLNLLFNTLFLPQDLHCAIQGWHPLSPPPLFNISIIWTDHHFHIDKLPIHFVALINPSPAFILLHG